MNWSYIAFLAGLLLVVYVLVRSVVKAQRRFGRAAAWGVIMLEAVGIGFLMYLAVKYVPGVSDTALGSQLILAMVGIGLAIVVGGGLVMALGRR